MNGAESLIRTAVSSGVELCLANPGTTEMQLVAALEPPGQVATLIVPQDCAWDRVAGPAPPVKPRARGSVPDARVESAAAALESSAPSALFLGGSGLRAPALRAAARIAAATGRARIPETFAARIERGA